MNETREIPHDTTTMAFVAVCLIAFGVWYSFPGNKKEKPSTVTGFTMLVPEPDNKLDLRPPTQRAYIDKMTELEKAKANLQRGDGVLGYQDWKKEQERLSASQLDLACSLRTVEDWVGTANMWEDGRVSVLGLGGTENVFTNLVLGNIPKGTTAYEHIGRRQHTPVVFSGKVLLDCATMKNKYARGRIKEHFKFTKIAPL